MKIATYNIWNESKSLEARAEQILDEIKTVDADVIGLREVTPQFYKNYI